MGEAKRRRDYERAHADELEAVLGQRRARFAWIEQVAAMEGDVEAISEALSATRRRAEMESDDFDWASWYRAEQANSEAGRVAVAEQLAPHTATRR